MDYPVLSQAIPDFDDLEKLLKDFPNVIDTGKLAEFYCEKLFDLTLIKPRNISPYDAIDPDGKKVEIKYRFLLEDRTPPGMRINLEEIDYLLYVNLNEDTLLPEKIHRIEKKDIDYTTGKRVSFKRAFEEKRAKVVFQR